MAGFGLGGVDKTPQPLRQEVEPPSTPTIDPSVWENVLRQTAGKDESDDPLTHAELEALREVARRYPGQPLTLQPIAAELVQAVVMPRIPADHKDAKFLQDAFERIAQTQLDDPVANDRLHHLWSQLQGERS
jgi:hypothetical protein